MQLPQAFICIALIFAFRVQPVLVQSPSKGEPRMK